MSFTIVQSKSKNKRKLRKSAHLKADRDSSPVEVDVLKVLKQIENFEFELQSSEFLQKALNSLTQTLQQVKIQEVICLGIGKVSECSIAKHQFAFISIIQQHFRIPSVKFYDPVFTSSDRELLQKLNYEILADNKEGQHQANYPTLFYLPHCPKQITNNLLFRNWAPEHLQNLFLVCNSFISIIESIPERLLRPNAHYILEINQFTVESQIENCFRFTDIFNDFSVHSFPSEKLDSAPASFWKNRPEPNYSEEDLELVRNGSS